VVIVCQGRIKDTAIETVSAISPERLDFPNLEEEDPGCNQACRLALYDKGTIQSISSGNQWSACFGRVFVRT
jgi:hypothetical protein